VAVDKIRKLYEHFEFWWSTDIFEGDYSISVSIIMGLTISNLFTRLFGKKQMRILMGKQNIDVLSFILKYTVRQIKMLIYIIVG